MIDVKNYKLNLTNQENKIWFTSDTHFGHKAIMKYCHRPFENIEEHDERIIENWNSMIKPDDIVFHLGDVGFDHPKRINEILNRLNGKICLIIGNHDYKAIIKQHASRFEFMVPQLCLKIGEHQIILNHCPLLCYPGMYRGHWQLYGHVHSGPLSNDGLDIPLLKYLSKLQYDVGVDNNDFKPVSYNQLTNIIK